MKQVVNFFMQFESVKNNPILIILFILLVTLCTLFLLSRNNSQEWVYEGMADLSSTDFDSGDIYKLNGDWEFFSSALIPAGEAKHIPVPGSWNSRQKPVGFGTYRLKVLIPVEREDLMLLMPSTATAYKLFINGIEKAYNGRIATEASQSEPEFRYRLVDVGAHSGELELVIKISNFHYSKGGLWTAPSIGSGNAIKRYFLTRMFTETAISGGVFLVGIILIALFLVRKEYLSYANLGLFCLLMSIRTIIVGEIPMTYFFPHFNWSLMLHLEYLSISLGFIFINSYFYNIYRRFYNRKLYLLFNLAALAFTLLILATSPLIFSKWLIPLQLLMGAGILHFFYLFIISSAQMKSENIIVVTGISVMLIMVVLDILMANNFLMFLPVKIHTSLGLVVLIFSNSLLLIKQAAATSQRMKEMTDNLEKLVEQRTAELEQANTMLSRQAITDALTGVYNRQELSNIMKNEDARYSRTGKTYAALYMDLDNFKHINDTYGHPAGDFMLERFSTLLKSIVREADFLFRLGGDEFFILMTEIHSENEAIVLAERILKEMKDQGYLIDQLEDYLEQKVTIPDSRKFSLSIGLSSTDRNKPDKLYYLTEMADMALLEAKSRGKNRYALFGDK